MNIFFIKNIFLCVRFLRFKTVFILQFPNAHNTHYKGRPLKIRDKNKLSRCKQSE